MDLKELGSQLKEERERQGLSIAQVMDLTKISRRNIQAIEAGDETELPHPVYAKGFVKIYSKSLGFNSEEFGEAFASVCPIESEYDDENLCKSVSEDYNEGEVVSSIKRKKSSAPLFFVLIIVLAILAIGAFYYFDKGSVNSFFKSDDTISSNINNEVISESNPQASAEEIASSENNEEDSVQPESQINSSNSPSVKENSSEIESSGIEVTNDSATLETESSVPENANIASSLRAVDNSIIITAKESESCWIEILADDLVPRSVILKNGESITVSYDKKLRIKLGNSGGVLIKKNGSNYPLPSTDGRVKTLTFS